jgi:hypothetical protein
MGPFEPQRRIVNSALESGAMEHVLWLCAAYAALVLGAGGIKLGFNAYRGWISKSAVRGGRIPAKPHQTIFSSMKNAPKGMSSTRRSCRVL